MAGGGDLAPVDQADIQSQLVHDLAGILAIQPNIIGDDCRHQAQHGDDDEVPHGANVGLVKANTGQLRAKLRIRPNVIGPAGAIAGVWTMMRMAKKKEAANEGGLSSRRI